MIDVVLGIHDGVLTSGGMMITTSQALAASSCPASSSTVDVDLALHAPTVGFFHQWEGLTEKKRMVDSNFLLQELKVMFSPRVPP